MIFWGELIDIKDNNAADVKDGKVDKQVKSGEAFLVKMGAKPLSISVKDSMCIEGINSEVQAGLNGDVLLNMMWNLFSTFSTSTDATNGTTWRYFPADRVITTKVKNTPECQEWLKRAVVSDQYVPLPVQNSTIATDSVTQ